MMKRIAVAVLACWALSQAGAAELNWMTSLPKAQEKAKAEHKLVMMDFTGSDWCPYCIRLNRNVFSSAAFAKYAKENLIAVEVDFPRSKPQSEEQKKANKQLQEKYSIDGFPTVVVLDSNGKKLGQLVGYDGESPDEFIAKLEKMKKSKSS